MNFSVSNSDFDRTNLSARADNVDLFLVTLGNTFLLAKIELTKPKDFFFFIATRLLINIVLKVSYLTI